MGMEMEVSLNGGDGYEPWSPCKTLVQLQTYRWRQLGCTKLVRLNVAM